MQTTFKHSGNISMKDIVLRMHGEDEHTDKATSNPAQISLPSKEETKKIAKFIERASGMEIRDTIKKDGVRVEFVSREKATMISQEETYKIFEKFIDSPAALQQLRKKISEDVFHGENVPAFFSPSDNTIYFITETTEEKIKKRCDSKGVERDSPEGKSIERFFILHSFVHEIIHQTIKENYPSVGNWHLNTVAEDAKMVLASLEPQNQSQEKQEDFAKLIKEIGAKKKLMHAYNEGIAYRAGYEVLCQLHYSSSAAKEYKKAREDEKHYEDIPKGIKFLEAIERKTGGQNPITFTTKNPPQSMEELKDANKYLARIGWER